MGASVGILYMMFYNVLITSNVVQNVKYKKEIEDDIACFEQGRPDLIVHPSRKAY